jgi:phosphohistidine swiveling domain-containing protein
MSKESVIKKLKSMKWERWFDRPFNAFTLSFFEDDCKKGSAEAINIPGLNIRAQLFQKGAWYMDPIILKEMDSDIDKYFSKHNMLDITKNLNKFSEESKKTIDKLIKSKEPIEKRFEILFNILGKATLFIWLTHGIEEYYNKRLKEIVPKYVKGDIDKFIGDASFPKKKNIYVKMEEMVRSKASNEEIAEKYGWLKVRGDFSEPFTTEDIAKQRKELCPRKEAPKIIIPKQLKKIIGEVQELVFFRTERTDVFYELYFRGMPLIKELANKYKIPFEEIKYYRAKSFISGKSERYPKSFCMFSLEDETYFQNEPIIDDNLITEKTEFKGNIAYKGVVRGIVKIVKNISELDKVKKGDILVTPMTFPSFIAAMNIASAFVTDEGGITCHAAIIAREMHKPCIIGTKIATKILKDGDLIEVDADKGIVKILKRK